MGKWSLHIFWLVCSLFAFAMGTAQELNFNQFGRAEGLPADGVYDMIQASNGLLWIATEGGGISSFNGKDFTTYNTDSGLPDNTVRCVFEDSQKRIWIGTANGGVAYFENLKWHIPRFNIELPSVHVRSFIEDDEGNLYIAMFKGGLVKINEGQLFEFTQKPIAKASIRTLQKDNQNQLWAGTDEGLFLVNDEQIIPHPLDSLGIKTLCSFPYKAGVLFGTDTGLIYASKDTLMPLSHPLISRTRIKSIALDSHGDLWLGGSSGAIQFSLKSPFELEIINLVSETEGLKNARIRKLLLDRSNTLWFGTYYGGVAQLTGEAFSKFTRENHYPENYITSLHFVENTIWIGTFEGSIYQSDGSQLIKVYQSTSTDADNPVHRIFDVENKVAAVVQNDGLVMFTNSKPKLYSPYFPPYKDAVVVGETMHVLSSSGISTLSGTNFSFKWDGINVAEVSNNEVLIGTTEGIGRIPINGNELIYDELDWIAGSEQLEVTCAAIDSQGNVWFGSSNQGLSRWNGKKLKVYKRKSILPHPHVCGITFDSDDNLWVSTRKGLVHVELDPSQEFVLDTKEYENAVPG
ncbi:MAG: ligand-binding sensor domain-containing protein, partial [Flavobacteriales bacterium]